MLRVAPARCTTQRLLHTLVMQHTDDSMPLQKYTICCRRFIGELYKVGLLKEKFVHYSFDDLLPQDQVCVNILINTTTATISFISAVGI
jgi:hypothetical protein